MAKMFTRGETVRLASGGPLMTVVEVVEGSVVTDAYCKWFVGEQQVQEHKFPEEALRRASPPSEPSVPVAAAGVPPANR